jgi:hypothetical protein
MENLHVFISILCDEATERAQKAEACIRIQSAVSKISGIKSVHFTGNDKVADVTAFAEWDESEIHSRLEEIQTIPGVKSAEARILVPL